MPPTLFRRKDEDLIRETSDGPIETQIDRIREGSVKLSIDGPGGAGVEG